MFVKANDELAKREKKVAHTLQKKNVIFLLFSSSWYGWAEFCEQLNIAEAHI